MFAARATELFYNSSGYCSCSCLDRITALNTLIVDQQHLQGDSSFFMRKIFIMTTKASENEKVSRGNCVNEESLHADEKHAGVLHIFIRAHAQDCHHAQRHA